MQRAAWLIGPLVLLSACLSGEVALHVRADGSGQAVITTHYRASGMQAFDAMFPDVPQEPPRLETVLPEPFQGAVTREFGPRSTLESSRLAREADGGTRTTVVDFADVRDLHLELPSRLAFPPAPIFDMRMWADVPVLTLETRRHENGDRLLVVKMPEPRSRAAAVADPTAAITRFETGSNEERLFKEAIKGLALKVTVGLDQPILRTNAPARDGEGAVIVNLDLDRMINAMDEAKAQRMLLPGAFQEVLWQIGDLPGAVMPTDLEVFLEYEGVQAPAQATAAQAPPDTEIYLAPMHTTNGLISIGTPEDISNNPGYDNQPFFTADGQALFYTSIRGGAAQSDIYKYDITTRQTAQITRTPESEYSPTVTPLGMLSVVRVELDLAKTQRLWRFAPDGSDPQVVLAGVKPVGYHAWANDHVVALYILGAAGQPATLQVADIHTGVSRTVATDIGRSLARIPGRDAISFVQRDHVNGQLALTIKAFDPATGAVSAITPAVPGSQEADIAWTPDGALLMVKDDVLYVWHRGNSGWQEIASLERLSLHGVTRLAVSPKGDALALVGTPARSR